MADRWLWVVPIIVLTACKPSAGPPQNVEAEAQANQAATVAALPPGQRDGVFFRAIRDAGLPCQDIISAEPLPPEQNAAQWRVRCEDKVPYLIAVPPTGPLIVTSRTSS